ncbi:IclR family transcriptional regulator [Xanthobacter sp. 91]|uniref:IclR family transcriptional regulator n=1 Tax=Xanthobacter sp. 91 TaxID=1117244 RepID=UPI00068F6B7C|nr:IclR family transcriptional regulator [Xanthobacter sp. 91]
MKSAGGVEAVDRAFRILGAFRDGDTALSLHELSERTGFYKSTLLRLAVSLERAGCLVRMPDKTYALGFEVMRLGSLYQRSFRLDRHVRPILRELVRETGESASFFHRDGPVRVCLFREDSNHPIRDHIREGDVLALDKGAAGHVLTAFSRTRDAAERRKLLANLPWVSQGERDTETAAISVPVFSGGISLAGALTISGPRTRFTPSQIAIMSPVLLAAGQELTTILGGQWR